MVNKIIDDKEIGKLLRKIDNGFYYFLEAYDSNNKLLKDIELANQSMIDAVEHRHIVNDVLTEVKALIKDWAKEKR